MTRPLISALILFASPCLAQDSLLAGNVPLAEAGRRVFQQAEDALVTVAATLEIQISVNGQNQSQEQQLEVDGTVMASNGLTVVPNSSIDIGAQIEQQVKRQVRGGEVDIKTRFQDVKILLRDGTEIPAKVVLNDKDLDVAFILPDAKEVEAEAVEFTPVTFPDDTPEVALIDPIIILERLNKTLDRELSVHLTTVTALVKKPRPFILTHNASLGTPAFTPNGVPIGLFVRRVVNETAGGVVILPSKDLARIGKEAATAEPKEDDPQEDSTTPAPEEPKDESPLDDEKEEQ